MQKIAFIPIFIFFMLSLPLVHAENFVVVNSRDGRDVLSAIFYASAKNEPVVFLPLNGNVEMITAKIGSSRDILLIESEKFPVSAYTGLSLKNNGNIVTSMKSPGGPALNLDLAKKSGADKFIIVDSAYADNAVSALPYAKKINAYILFADKNNANSIKEIVKNAKKILIYGYIDNEVRASLSEFNPEQIGRGEDKFEDNIAMVDKVVSEFNEKQVYVTDGSFIEDSIIAGSSPVLYIGKIIPKTTYDFIKQSTINGKIEVYVVLNDNLARPLYDVRDSIRKELKEKNINMDFAVLLKIGQAIPSYSGTEMLGLDRFPIPTYTPLLNISYFAYNKASKKLEVTVNNIGDGLAYFANEIKILVNGVEYTSLADTGPQRLSRQDSQGSDYVFELPAAEGHITANILTRYGATKTSLDQYAYLSGVLSQVEFKDESDIAIISAKYYKQKNIIAVTYKNPTSQDLFVKPEIELNLNGALTKITSDRTFKIGPNAAYIDEMPFELSDKDLQNNKDIKLTVYYGSREGFLRKTKTSSVSLQVDQINDYILLMAITVLLLIVAFFSYKKFFGSKTGKNG